MKQIVAMLTVAVAGLFFGSLTARAADITGKWHFVLETPGGNREVDVNLTAAGNQVSGTWGTAPVQGTFKEPNLDLSFPYTSEESGDKGTLQVKGQLQGDTLTGKWEFGEYSGTYKATRQN